MGLSLGWGAVCDMPCLNEGKSTGPYLGFGEHHHTFMHISSEACVLLLAFYPSFVARTRCVMNIAATRTLQLRCKLALIHPRLLDQVDSGTSTQGKFASG